MIRSKLGSQQIYPDPRSLADRLLNRRAVSADIVKRVQGSEERDAVAIEDLPDDADRALSIVSGKLDTKLSVEYTVNQLIQEAMDPANLSQLFHGWQSYL